MTDKERDWRPDLTPSQIAAAREAFEKEQQETCDNIDSIMSKQLAWKYWLADWNPE